MLTYLDPPENIGIKCQKEPFDIESLRDKLRGENNTSPMQEERLERIPSVKKLAGPADIMPVEEAEYKVRQYCHLWTMYADSSVELKKKSELSQESAVAACKMYVPYISNIENRGSSKKVTVTPPALMGTAAPTQPTEPHNNLLFNLLDNNQPRTSTLMHTPHNGTSLATPADLLDGITQIMN